MKIKLALLAVLVFSIFLLGCEQSQTGYSAYNQPQGQQQPYVGGGCGVAPDGNYEDTPLAKIFNEVENF